MKVITVMSPFACVSLESMYMCVQETLWRHVVQPNEVAYQKLGTDRSSLLISRTSMGTYKGLWKEFHIHNHVTTLALQLQHERQM